MKRLLLAAAIAATSLPAFAEVGVSIGIGQPGFYGQIDIGDYPRPVYYNPRPTIVTRAPRGYVAQPAYLRVPPGHRRNWSRHCHRYNACGNQVYFVQDRWYNEVYVPQYRERHYRADRDGRGRDDHRRYGYRKGHHEDHRRHDDRDDRRDDRRYDRND